MDPARFGICYLTDNLPYELRVRIYGMVLSTEQPLFLKSHFDSQISIDRSQDFCLLRTCKFIYSEALPAFYAVNMIQVKRSDFCRRNGWQFRFPFKPRLIRSLYVADLDPSEKCSRILWNTKQCGNQLGPSPAKRHSTFFCHWKDCRRCLDYGISPGDDSPCAFKRYEIHPCQSCGPSCYSFLKDLSSLPQLRNALVNCEGNFRAIVELRSELAHLRQESTLKCTSIGELVVQGEWMRLVDIKLQNTTLFKLWPILWELEGDLFDMRMTPPFDTLIDRRDSLASRLMLILQHHDLERFRWIPRAIASIWPEDLPQDLRLAVAVGEKNPEILSALHASVELALAGWTDNVVPVGYWVSRREK